jgi:hypothetical protein
MLSNAYSFAERELLYLKGYKKRTRAYDRENHPKVVLLFYTPFSSLCSALHHPVESYFIQKSSFGLNSFVICRSNILASAMVQSLYRLL